MEGEALRLGAMRAVNALRDDEADEAGGAVPAISSSVIASCDVSCTIVISEAVSFSRIGG